MRPKVAVTALRIGGIAIFLLVILLIYVNWHLPESQSDAAHHAIQGNTTFNDISGKDHSSANPRRRPSSSQSPKQREPIWEDFKPIEWTTEQLDSYLLSKSKELTNSQLEALITAIFPEPNGSAPRPNVLVPGSISLNDQLILCKKHLASDEFPAAIAGIWAKYKKTESIGQFRREIIDRLESGSFRTEMMGNYCSYLTRDLSKFTNFLNSAEIEEILDGPSCDQTGFTKGLRSSISRMIVEDVESHDSIVTTINQSSLNLEIKSNLLNYSSTLRDKARQSRNNSTK